MDNTQHILDRVRPPRVQITYDVEIGNAIQKKELPFVIGIIADLAGKTNLSKLKDRKFVEIDRDNINTIISKISPTLSYEVKNTISPDTQQLGVQLTISSMEDFDPVAVLKQIPELNNLYQARCKLKDLAAKLEGNEFLQETLKMCVSDKNILATLKKQLDDKVGANKKPSDSSKDNLVNNK